MGAGTHVVAWPKVRIMVDGEAQVLDRGDTVPDGVSSIDLENLTTFGAVAGVTVVEPTDEADGTPAKPARVADILKAVGKDKDLAQVALEEELARGDDARNGLVSKLQAVLTDA